jgi:hypothetical protein
MTIHLTERDLRLLVKCALCRWLTTDRLKRMYFPEATLNAVQKRLRKLSDAGYLRSYREHPTAESFHSVGPNGGRGTYMRADKDVLTSTFPAYYRGSYRLAGESIPLAVRLRDGSLLVNGARLEWPVRRHQRNVLNALQQPSGAFGVVPFHSIVAAWTGGEVRDWNQKPIPFRDLQREVAIVVPSGGERWQTVTEKDKHGRNHTRQIHTLGDSVIRLQDRFYLSAVDPTGMGSGMYFLAELLTDRMPQSLAEAFDVLKPKIVREAEAHGAYVGRGARRRRLPRAPRARPRRPSPARRGRHLPSRPAQRRGLCPRRAQPHGG